jgi:hypothetical protein
MPDPTPTPNPRPLVEAWGVRDDHQVSFVEMTQDEYRALDYQAGEDGDRYTVVPLIAADRLTDEALVEAVTAALWRHGSNQAHLASATPAVLAALRAHLETR